MSTPFTSGFVGGKIPPLKFWSYKILPLVYEDALSYYEVLCQVREKLNETIDRVNLSTEEVATIRETVNEIQETIDAINAGMVKSVNGKYPDADGGVIVDAPSVPMNPPLIIGGENRNYLQEAISALIAVDEQAAEELREYMTNSAPYLVQIVSVGGTPELSVSGADYDEMVQNVGEHERNILVSFPDDEYTYNGESYRTYTQVGKLIGNSVLEVSRIVSVSAGTFCEQYRFDRNGYISYARHTYPELPVVPYENDEYVLVRTSNGLQWGTTQGIKDSIDDLVDDVDILNQYWKPTVLPVIYTPSNGSATPDYSSADFSELLPTDEGAILVEIRVANQAPVHVQGYFVLGDATHASYVHAVVHDKVDTKNVLRVYLLYSTYVNVLTYDLDVLNNAVLTVNGRTPDSSGAVSIDATLIMLGGTPLPVSVRDEIIRIGTQSEDNDTTLKGLIEDLTGFPQDGQRYRFTGRYNTTDGTYSYQWVLDT